MMEGSTGAVAVGWGGALGRVVASSYDRVRRFVHDHKKGLLCLAVTGGVAAYAVYRVGRGYRELQEASRHRLRLQGAFESTQSMCTSTAGPLVAKLNDAVVRLVPIPTPQELRASLQQPKEGQDRYALWEHCKNQTFVRLVVGVYGAVLLSTFLRVQVTLLGRYLYLETLIAKDPAARLRIPLEVALSQDTQKRYLAYSEYLLNSGLPELVAHVQAIAQQVLSGYALQRSCSFEDVLSIIDDIRRRVELPTGSDAHDTIVNSFLLPKECADGGEAQGDRKLEMLLNETRDVLESLEFNQTLGRCLNLGFYALSQHIRACFTPPLQEAPKGSRDFAAPSNPDKGLETALPMAKLMPLINKQVSHMHTADPNPYLEAVLRDDQLLQYAFDLFVAFNAD